MIAAGITVIAPDISLIAAGITVIAPGITVIAPAISAVGGVGFGVDSGQASARHVIEAAWIEPKGRRSGFS